MAMKRALSFLRARPRLLAGGALALLGLTAGGTGLAIGTWRNVCYDCPSIAQLYAWEPTQSTKILDREGELITEIGERRRTPVDIDDLPDYVPHAFIAIEDRRFRQHSGFDLRGLLRGGFNLVLGRWNEGGGSTITQQLARNMFEQEIGYEQSIERKFKELKVARELETVYSKDEILEAYINQILYGRGWWGIESGARNYFSKPATELNPAEAAMLAAVINSPGTYSPFSNPELAERRRNLVLELMAQQRYLDREEVERWKRHPLPTVAEDGGDDEGDVAPYFVEWVRDQLDDRYGPDLYRRGFRVYTTLDVEVQRRAERAMVNGWERIESQPGFGRPTYAEVMEDGGSGGASRTEYLQGMFVALDPHTGDVLAMIGGRDFGDSKFNRATQARRQPGSVFKPIVYAAAIASGLPPTHVIVDAPDIEIMQDDSTIWSPSNFENQFYGELTLREALRRSINVVAVKLGMEIGLETVAQYARRLGLTTPVPRYESTSIGAAEVIPLEIAAAYSGFAGDGERIRPRPILRVEDPDGRVLWEAQTERERALDPETTYIIRDMLREALDNGTGYNGIRNPAIPPALSYEIPAGGKTGTTNDNTNVWFVGFTPDLLAGVWFGFDEPETILPNATGGGFAAPVWGEFMHAIYEGEEPLLEAPVEDPWPMPEMLTTRFVDSESGRLATEWCPEEQVYEEVYLPGTEPDEFCDLHGPGIFGAPVRGYTPPEPARGDTAPPDTLGADTLIGSGGPVRRDTIRRDTIRRDTIR